jgi:hypothetical protein
MSERDGACKPIIAREPVGSRAMRSWRASVDEALTTVVAGARATYDRHRALPRLIAFDVRDLSNSGPALDAAIRARLKRALRAERRRGIAGHWTYDLSRHVGLMQALAAEEAAEKLPPRA